MSGRGTSEIMFQPRVRKQAGVCRNVRPLIRPFEREIYVQPVEDKRSALQRPRSRPATATFRRIDSGARVCERDAKFRPRRTSSAEGQTDRGGAPARSRLHEKETSGGRWRTEEKISMEPDDRTFEGLGGGGYRPVTALGILLF